MSTEHDDGGDERDEGSPGEKLAAMLAEADPPPPEEPLLDLPVGLHLDVSHEQYHRDPTGTRISLSSSIASKIAEKSPRHGWRLHPKLGGKTIKPTATMDAGALLHMLVLGRGPMVRVVDAKDWRTKAAKAAKADARAAGEVPMLAKVWEDLVDTSVGIRTELQRRGIDLSAGAPEATIIWNEQTDAGEALCRARADIWHEQEGTIYDVKFLAAAEAQAFQRHMLAFGCDVQAAAYTSGFGKVFPELEGRLLFKFIVIEQETGEIAIYRPSGGMRQLGDFKWGYAVRRWTECLASGVWLGLNDDQETIIDAPEYATRDLLKGGSPGIPF